MSPASRRLTVSEVDADPSLLTTAIDDRQGLHFALRLLEATDAQRLGRFFDDLQQASRRVYGPHPLHSEHASLLCEQIDRKTCWRFIALGPVPDHPDQVTAYMILELGVRDKDAARYEEVDHPLDPTATATFAPVVGDVWQEQGLGSSMIRPIIDAAVDVGLKQIILMGGVRDDNPRARHFYEKAGFQRVRGFFAGGVDNHDMMLPL